LARGPLQNAGLTNPESTRPNTLIGNLAETH
jgi:hypothetical protein